jgi:uncharacterized protein YmfQ (DUF2313 family)
MMALIDLLTDNYPKSPQVVGLQEAFSYYTDKLKTTKIDLFDQFHVETATWGLTAWEESLGIDADVSASKDFRRERICAKLRGTGTITKAMIEQTAAAYSNGEVEVIEDTANNSFKIKFVGTKGLPPNMADLTLTIEEIKPAHLSYAFEYVYRTHTELSIYTYAQLSSYNHDQLREGEIN